MYLCVYFPLTTKYLSIYKLHVRNILNVVNGDMAFSKLLVTRPLAVRAKASRPVYACLGAESSAVYILNFIIVFCLFLFVDLWMFATRHGTENHRLT